MPTAREMYASGRLDAAIESLGAELRSNPTDTQRRTFLFELLSMAGQYDRAEKQLDVLARAGTQAEAGTLLYRAAVSAERVREHMFATGDYPSAPAPGPVAGTLDDGTGPRPFAEIEDADPRLGARLEVIAGGRYLWIPFAHLAAVRLDPPKRLRDLRWGPAHVATNASVRDMELGEVLLPALTPAAWRQEDPEVRLGRATDWEELPTGEFAPLGQKVLRIDGELVPLLAVRELVLTSVPEPAA